MGDRNCPACGAHACAWLDLRLAGLTCVKYVFFVCRSPWNGTDVCCTVPFGYFSFRITITDSTATLYASQRWTNVHMSTMIVAATVCISTKFGRTTVSRRVLWSRTPFWIHYFPNLLLLSAIFMCFTIAKPNFSIYWHTIYVSHNAIGIFVCTSINRSGKYYVWQWLDSSTIGKAANIWFHQNTNRSTDEQPFALCDC